MGPLTVSITPKKRIFSLRAKLVCDVLLLEAGTGPVLVALAYLATCTMGLPGQELQLTSSKNFLPAN